MPEQHDTDKEVYAVTVRLPIALKNAIAEQAKKNRRSLNAEIVLMLERAMQQSAPEDKQSSR